MVNDISAVICKIFEQKVKGEDVEISQQSCKALWDLLATIDQREAIAIVLIDISGLTYKQVGEIFAVSTERVRQIVAKAYRKLRHPTRSSKLKIYCQ